MALRGINFLQFTLNLINFVNWSECVPSPIPSRMKKYLLTLLTLVLTIAVSGFAAPAATPGDSLQLLLDRYDVAPVEDRVKICEEIYGVAKRAGDVPAQLDILRLLSVGVSDENTLSKIIKEINTFQPSQNRDEVALFVKMRLISLRARALSEEDRQKEIIKILNSFDTKKADNLHRQILDLYTLVEFMRKNATGDMLRPYLERLEKLADSPDIKLLPVRNIIKSEMASIYSDAGEQEKAVEANRKVLQLIDRQEADYREQGRKNRKYDISRYVVYRRMLRNYKALQPGEAEKFYRLAMALGESNPDVQREIDRNPRIHAFYYMSKGDYQSAIPMLKDAIRRNNRLPALKQFLELLIFATEKTGDDKTRTEALEQYVSIMKQLDEEKADEKTRELQIRYDLQDLKERNDALEVENQQQLISSERSIMTFVTVAFIILLIVFIILMLNWGRYKNNVGRMGMVVDNMHRERQRLRETLYTNDYMAMDPLAEDDRYSEIKWEKRLKEAHKRLGDATIFMTESIINDLLYIAWVGHEGLTNHIQSMSVDSILRQAAAWGTDRIGDESFIRVEYPEDDFNIVTDSECMVALLGHMFVVAHDFDSKAMLELTSRRQGENNVDFILTIVGASPAALDGAQIFKDMPISDVLLNHKDSGMFICRMISMLMQCEIIPDLKYDKGARYVVRTHIKMDK